MSKGRETRPKTVNTTASTATSSTLQTFSNSEFGDVRVIMQDDEPWFVGKDVADSLDYQNGSRDINRHVAPEDRTKEMVFDGNQRKETILINESGLYSLILSSKLPSAKKFKRWVTSEVLPTIRKTGGYVDENRSDLFLDICKCDTKRAQLSTMPFGLLRNFNIHRFTTVYISIFICFKKLSKITKS